MVDVWYRMFEDDSPRLFIYGVPEGVGKRIAMNLENDFPGFIWEAWTE